MDYFIWGPSDTHVEVESHFNESEVEVVGRKRGRKMYNYSNGEEGASALIEKNPCNPAGACH